MQGNHGGLQDQVWKKRWTFCAMTQSSKNR